MVAEGLGVTSTVQQHVRDHLQDFVALKPRRDIRGRFGWGGLWQLRDAALDSHPGLPNHQGGAEAVVCLTSALALHELTDIIPPRVWMAVGSKDWRPRATHSAADRALQRLRTSKLPSGRPSRPKQVPAGPVATPAR